MLSSPLARVRYRSRVETRECDDFRRIIFSLACKITHDTYVHSISIRAMRFSYPKSRRRRRGTVRWEYFRYTVIYTRLFYIYIYDPGEITSKTYTVYDVYAIFVCFSTCRPESRNPDRPVLRAYVILYRAFTTACRVTTVNHIYSTPPPAEAFVCLRMCSHSRDKSTRAMIFGDVSAAQRAWCHIRARVRLHNRTLRQQSGKYRFARRDPVYRSNGLSTTIIITVGRNETREMVTQ